jgi:hypothetical protein
MFVVTSEARTALSTVLENSGGSLVPLVTWESDSRFSTGQWILGFVERDRAERTKGVSWIEVNGVEFAVDGPHHYLHFLDRATLEYSESQFVFQGQG